MYEFFLFKNHRVIAVEQFRKKQFFKWHACYLAIAASFAKKKKLSF